MLDFFITRNYITKTFGKDGSESVTFEREAVKSEHDTENFDNSKPMGAGETRAYRESRVIGLVSFAARAFFFCLNFPTEV